MLIKFQNILNLLIKKKKSYMPTAIEKDMNLILLLTFIIKEIYL